MIYGRLFCNKNLRKKLIFTIFVLAVSQILIHIPAFGLDTSYISSLFGSGGILGFASALSGGALDTFSLGAFGITSYITASIILQLFCIICPKMEAIRKDGEYGRVWYEKVEYILSFAIIVISSVGMAYGLRNAGLFDNDINAITCMAGWIICGLIIVILGKKVEEYGIGNGISLILTFNILSSIPDDLYVYYKETIDGHSMNIAVRNGIIFIIGIFILVLIAVYQQHGAIKVPITQSRKDSEGIEYSSHIPIPVNIANVFPVIYAATIMSIPGLIATFMSMSGKNIGETGEKVISVFSNSNWYDPQEPYQLIGLSIYLVLLVTMAFFSSILVFNPAEIADNMIKNGNVIDGIAPGIPTEKYFDRRRKVMAILNVIILSVLVILPDLLFVRFGLLQMSFLGTSLVIVISTLNDTSIRLKGAALSASNNFNLWRDKNGSIE